MSAQFPAVVTFHTNGAVMPHQRVRAYIAMECDGALVPTDQFCSGPDAQTATLALYEWWTAKQRTDALARDAAAKTAVLREFV